MLNVTCIGSRVNLMCSVSILVRSCTARVVGLGIVTLCNYLIAWSAIGKFRLPTSILEKTLYKITKITS